MATEKQKEKFNDYLKVILGPRSNLVEPYVGVEGNKRLLHISTNTKIKEFVPVVSRRTAKNEDRTVPRVCVAASIMDCINGYVSFLVDFMDHSPEEWKGGYVIYEIPYTVAGSPDKSLVPDVELTKEKWILPFDATHREIEPKKVGKMFVSNVFIENSSGNERTWSAVFYVNVSEPTGLWLTETTKLEQGYWRVQLAYSKDRWQFDDSTISFSEVPRTEYTQAKGVTAGLLSYAAPSDSW